MRTNSWIYWLVIGILAVAVAALAPTAAIQAKRARELRKECNDKQEVIDTLIRRKMSLFDVEFNVKDDSKNTFKWQKNSGEINYSQEKTYWLKIDSLSLQAVR